MVIDYDLWLLLLKIQTNMIKISIFISLKMFNWLNLSYFILNYHPFPYFKLNRYYFSLYFKNIHIEQLLAYLVFYKIFKFLIFFIVIFRINLIIQKNIKNVIFLNYFLVYLFKEKYLK
jgi:hypothetical protein